MSIKSHWRQVFPLGYCQITLECCVLAHCCSTPWQRLDHHAAECWTRQPHVPLFTDASARHPIPRFAKCPDKHRNIIRYGREGAERLWLLLCSAFVHLTDLLFIISHSGDLCSQTASCPKETTWPRINPRTEKNQNGKLKRSSF